MSFPMLTRQILLLLPLSCLSGALTLSFIGDSVIVAAASTAAASAAGTVAVSTVPFAVSSVAANSAFAAAATAYTNTESITVQLRPVVPLFVEF